MLRRTKVRVHETGAGICSLLRLGVWNRALARSIRGANRLAGSRGRHHPDLVSRLAQSHRLRARRARCSRASPQLYLRALQPWA